MFDQVGRMREVIVDSCEYCEGRGYTKHLGFSQCQCTMILEYCIELLFAFIPKQYWTLSLRDLTGVDPSYVGLVRKYITNLHNAMDHGLGILFTGANGVGKTSLQCEIGKAAVVNGYTVRYTTLERYINAARKSDDAFMDDIIAADVILLDEIDKAYIKQSSDFTIRKTEEFLRSCVAGNKPVIACTNADDDMLAETLGQSVVSLLSRKLKFIEILGDDYSRVLQDDWYRLLEDDFDYNHENIIANAVAMFQNQHQQEEEQWDR